MAMLGTLMPLEVLVASALAVGVAVAILVKVANIPPAGVNAPYMNDWNAAAKDPTDRWG
jgi:hypothetical protein